MKKKLLSIFYAFLASVLFTTSALAGGSVKLSAPTFSLGSLIANGILTGLGKTDVVVVLTASGPSDITCTNFGSNDVPGQSAPKIAAIGKLTLLGNDPLRKNGRSPFLVETENPSISWMEGGCPNSNWTANIDFTYWTNATISIYDKVTGALLLEQNYICATTRFPAAVSCTPVP